VVFFTYITLYDVNTPPTFFFNSRAYLRIGECAVQGADLHCREPGSGNWANFNRDNFQQNCRLPSNFIRFTRDLVHSTHTENPQSPANLIVRFGPQMKFFGAKNRGFRQDSCSVGNSVPIFPILGYVMYRYHVQSPVPFIGQNTRNYSLGAQLTVAPESQFRLER
jgi:hypothetical protein